MDDDRCSRLTARGAPCRGFLMAWYAGAPEPRPLTCRVHATDAERAAADAAKERFEAQYCNFDRFERMVNSTPECWSWGVEGECPALSLQSIAAETLNESELLAMRALVSWQAGRCAICGRIEDLVTDHDHKTGLVRGLLCRSCNTNEGFRQGTGDVFDRYRQSPPAHVLGIRLRYWDPFRQRYAGPAPQLDLDLDPWEDNPVTGL